MLFGFISNLLDKCIDLNLPVLTKNAEVSKVRQEGHYLFRSSASPIASKRCLIDLAVSVSSCLCS